MALNQSLTPVELNIGRLAIEKGWISSAQLESAIRERRDTKVYTLAQILLKRRLLTVRQFREMEEALRKSREVTEPASPTVPGSRPRQLGLYKVIGEVGRGGMAIVYKAMAPDGLPVAIKLLASAQDPTRVARFRREVSVLSRLRHPGIVTVLGAGEEKGCPYLVMELMPGGTLEDRLMAGPLPEAEALALMHDIADAMAAAHAVGVVHRDLKPANVLFNASGRPCIADFGLAKVADPSQNLTSTGMGLGTPHYMAPEQVTGASKEASPATDVYALGAILYRMLTGKVPFDAETILALHYKITKEDPVLPRQLSPALSPNVEALVMRCLEKESRARYVDGGEMSEALSAVRAGRAPRARPMSRRLKKALGRRAVWVPIGLAAACALGLLAWSPWRGDEPEPPQPPPVLPGNPLTTAEARTLLAAESPDADRLLEAVKLLLSKEPKLATELTSRARETLHANKPQEALDLLRQVGRLSPGDTQVELLSADARLAQNDKARAVEHLDRYLRARPDDQRRARQRWDLGTQLGDLDAVRDQPWHPEARTERARVLAEEDRWQEARAELDLALDLEPGHAAAKALRAEIETRQAAGNPR